MNQPQAVVYRGDFFSSLVGERVQRTVIPFAVPSEGTTPLLTDWRSSPDARYPVLKWQFILLTLTAGCCTCAVAGEPAPILLSNSHLTLRFDRRTGAWIGWVDARSGEDLVTGPVPRTMVLPPTVRRLDTEALRQAMVSHKALDLGDDWLYTPTPPSSTAASAFVQGRFEEGKWERTPIPSRRGTGDDRLHNRTGGFFYRRAWQIGNLPHMNWKGRNRHGHPASHAAV